MRFSERHGFMSINTVIQTDDVDDALKNCLWSALKMAYWDTATRSSVTGNYSISRKSNVPLYELCASLWLNLFKLPLDTLDQDWKEALGGLRRHFFECPWYELLDFVEFVANNYKDTQRNQLFMKTCNVYFEREMSAYRFVSGQITSVIAKEEIESIEKASSSAQDAVREHLNCALSLLSDRRTPDYRNSIKESISAVESLVLIILEETKGTLGDLLARIEEKTDLHPALKSAFSKLYGYTSDEGGIRHALLEESCLDYDDAKFMLVACSAFINYVTAKTKE